MKSKKVNPHIIKNYQLAKKVLNNITIKDNMSHYQLKVPEVLFISLLCEKFNSFKYYIEYKYKDFSSLVPNKKRYYRILEKLEKKEIVVIIDKAKNQHSIYNKLYFTIDFICNVCGEEFGNLYEQWLSWRTHIEENKENEDE